MNYLSHGYRFLDRPLFLVGSVVPDLLSVVNRKVRARSRLVKPVVESTKDDDVREVGLGILQHHADDAVFHRSELFQQLDGRVGKEFRRFMPDRFDHRPGLLGHIVVELMLDATLSKHNPLLLDQFYDAVASVDGQVVEDSVNQMATRETDRLAWFIERFLQERFLYDYRTDEGMFFRLNQVLRRVGLEPMPDECIAVLGSARDILAENYLDLLRPVEQPARDESH